MKQKLTLDIIEDILKKKDKLEYNKIIEMVEKEKKIEIDNAFKSTIFTNLNIDKRFINLGDNIWGLRVNYPYSKVHLPINELYEDQKIKEAETKSKLDEEIKTFVSNDE